MPSKKRKDTLLSEKVASIILAGGEGKRLYPLTKFRCKPAVSFGGLYRLIDIPISNSINAQIQNIYVLSQYLATSLHQHIIETYQLDPFHLTKIHLLSPEERAKGPEWYRGTGDAVRKNLHILSQAPVDYFLILSGDQLYNIDFIDMIHFAKETNADLVVASIPVEEKEAKRMGLLRVDKKKKIREFCEKPQEKAVLDHFHLEKEALKGHKVKDATHEHYLASMGIYVFKRKALFSLLEEKGNDFGKELIPLSLKKYHSFAYVYKGYWEDIGTVEAFFKANTALMSGKHCLDTYDETNPIFMYPHHLPSPLIRSTHIKDALISPGAVIDAKEITRSVIGVRTCVKKGTVLQDAVVLGNLSYTPTPYETAPEQFSIGEGCVIKNTVIDEHAHVGDGVQLINKQNLQHFDGDGIFIRDGIIIVASGTTLPEGFVL